MFKKLSKQRDLGLLVIRGGIGVMMLLHGWPLLVGGPAMWRGLATSVGLNFVPVFWGFMAAISEFLGGALLALGLGTRPALFLLICTMIGALNHHLRAGDPFVIYSRPIEMMIVFAGLFILGPGRYSVDRG